MIKINLRPFKTCVGTLLGIEVTSPKHQNLLHRHDFMRPTKREREVGYQPEYRVQGCPQPDTYPQTMIVT